MNNHIGEDADVFIIFWLLIFDEFVELLNQRKMLFNVSEKNVLDD